MTAAPPERAHSQVFRGDSTLKDIAYFPICLTRGWCSEGGKWGRWCTVGSEGFSWAVSACVVTFVPHTDLHD